MSDDQPRQGQHSFGQVRALDGVSLNVANG